MYIAYKCKENGKDEYKNIIFEIFHVVSVRMSGEILEDTKVGICGPDVNQGHLFFGLVGRRRSGW